MAATHSELWYLEQVDLLIGLAGEELARVADHTVASTAHKDEVIWFAEQPSKVNFFLKRVG